MVMWDGVDGQTRLPAEIYVQCSCLIFPTICKCCVNIRCFLSFSVTSHSVHGFAVRLDFLLSTQPSWCARFKREFIWFPFIYYCRMKKILRSLQLICCYCIWDISVNVNHGMCLLNLFRIFYMVIECGCGCDM